MTDDEADLTRLSHIMLFTLLMSESPSVVYSE